MKTKNKPWVDEYLVPLAPSDRVLEKANLYSDPQTAWSDWDRTEDLLWALVETKTDPKKLIPCLCDIAKHVLPVFARVYPKDKRPKEAIAAVRKLVKNPSAKNIAVIREHRRIMNECFDKSDGSSNKLLARLVVDAVKCVVEVTVLAIDKAFAGRASEDLVLFAEGAASDARYAIDSSTRYDATSGTWRAVMSDEYGDNSEGRWQLECIREHFPYPPIENENKK